MFSLVDAMFGEDQRTSLADQVQAGVMLLYNNEQAHGTGRLKIVRVSTAVV